MTNSRWILKRSPEEPKRFVILTRMSSFLLSLFPCFRFMTEHYICFVLSLSIYIYKSVYHFRKSSLIGVSGTVPIK